MDKDIIGTSIILREQKIEDAKFFAYWYNQPQVMFQCGSTQSTDEEREQSIINKKTEDAV